MPKKLLQIIGAAIVMAVIPALLSFLFIMFVGGENVDCIPIFRFNIGGRLGDAIACASSVFIAFFLFMTIGGVSLRVVGYIVSISWRWVRRMVR